MTEHEHDDAQDAGEAGLAEDLEIKDTEDADAVKGGFNPVDGVEQKFDPVDG
jgi:hypothetical protein